MVCEHERSYQRSYIGGFVHRSRLKKIIATMRRLGPMSGERWADFGCSNGFIIQTVLEKSVLDMSGVVGYDHSHDLLEKAAARGIENASFRFCDLNGPPVRGPDSGSFGLVTCFEVLEHVADYAVAFQHLVEAARPGGTIMVTVPNETGIPGLLKLFGRYAARRKPYGDFFAQCGLWAYVWALVTGGSIERFRQASPTGYGPHVGFDYRRLVAHVFDSYVTRGLLVLVEQSRTLFGMNVVLVYRASTAR